MYLGANGYTHRLGDQEWRGQRLGTPSTWYDPHVHTQRWQQHPAVIQFGVNNPTRRKRRQHNIGTHSAAVLLDLWAFCVNESAMFHQNLHGIKLVCGRCDGQRSVAVLRRARASRVGIHQKTQTAASQARHIRVTTAAPMKRTSACVLTWVLPPASNSDRHST